MNEPKIGIRYGKWLGYCHSDCEKCEPPKCMLMVTKEEKEYLRRVREERKNKK